MAYLSQDYKNWSAVHRYTIKQMHFQTSKKDKVGLWPAGFGFCSEDLLVTNEKIYKINNCYN